MDPHPLLHCSLPEPGMRVTLFAAFLILAWWHESNFVSSDYLGIENHSDSLYSDRLFHQQHEIAVSAKDFKHSPVI